MACNTPAGIKGTGAPLKGTKLDEAAPLAAEPPVPPPVKLAPFGPIGLELSENAHVLEVQMQSPLTGSQNGVEQFVGKRKRACEPAGTDCWGLGLSGEGVSTGHP